jgi:hypothetical protein
MTIINFKKNFQLYLILVLIIYMLINWLRYNPLEISYLISDYLVR